MIGAVCGVGGSSVTVNLAYSIGRVPVSATGSAGATRTDDAAE